MMRKYLLRGAIVMACVGALVLVGVQRSAGGIIIDPGIHFADGNHIVHTSKKTYNIGLLVVATGKYVNLVKALIESAESHFCKKHRVTYFIFTDGELPVHERSIKIQQSRLGWPYDTMMRFEMYARQADTFEKFDYLFACDADMRFVAEVGDEILGERVATLHPGFVGRRGTYETRATSLAYVRPNEGSHYFAGGFYGGSAKEFLSMMQYVSSNIRTDLEKKIIAVWHDESHLNRYFIDHKPTVILSPSYCYPESWNLPYKKRLLALDKNHDAMRS